MYHDQGAHDTRPNDAPQALVGRVLEGRYRLDQVLSSGGMGIIYVASQLSVGRKIAVKILRPTLSDELDLKHRFSQEVEVVASLSHPNIVSLIDAGRDAAGLMYLAMEFVEGETFREALQSVRMTLPELLDVFIQTCDALTEAHAANIIHRDLKFDNIMLQRRRDRRLHVKILDFGVAKLLTRDVNLTRGGQVPGTPGIIAPELVSQQAPSPRSDLYSLGVLLYTTLSGKAPFDGHNDLELMRAHQFEPVPQLTPLIQPYVPEALCQLIYELLEKQPEARPADANTTRARLENIKRQLRQEYPDLPPYIPPLFEEEQDRHGSGAYRIVPKRQRLTPPDLLAAADRSREELEHPDAAHQGKPLLVVPTSVVSMLALLLLVLIVTIVYLLQQTLL